MASSWALRWARARRRLATFEHARARIERAPSRKSPKRANRAIRPSGGNLDSASDTAVSALGSPRLSSQPVTKLGVKSVGEDRKLGLGLLQGPAGFQSAHHEELGRASIGQVSLCGPVNASRNPQGKPSIHIHAKIPAHEAFRGDADDGVGLAIQLQRRTQHPPVGSEALLPGSVTQDEQPLGASLNRLLGKKAHDPGTGDTPMTWK